MRAREPILSNGILNEGSRDRVEEFYYNFPKSVWNRLTLMFIYNVEKLPTDMHVDL